MKANPRTPNIRALFSPDHPHRRERHYTRWGRPLLISAVAVLLLFAATSAAVLWRIQQLAEQKAVAAVEERASAASRWLGDQLALVAALDPHWLLAAERNPRGSPWPLLASGKAWHALRVIDAEGTTLARYGPTEDLPARLVPPADRTSVTALPSLPLAGRNTWVTPILFPAGADGLRVIGFLSQSALARFVAPGAPRSEASLGLLAGDGRVLLRTPSPEVFIGQDWSRLPFFETAPDAAPPGRGWLPQEIEGRMRVMAYRRVDGYPLVVTAGVNAVALDRSHGEIIAGAVIVLVVLLFTGTVVSLLMHQFRHAEHLRDSLHKTEARLRELATHDSLTECLNRRTILVEASNELHRYRRTRRPFSLLMLDIDNFSQLNDRFGHLVGDSILVGTATLCRDLLRPTDQIGRFGGEEFLILLPETDAHTATRVANRLRSTVAGMAFETGKEQVSITLSIGVAVANPSMQSLKPLIQSAEAALVAAKAGGHDRVCLGGEAQPQTG